MYFGGRPLHKGDVDYPYFTKLRESGEDNDSKAILWPFDFDKSVEIAKSGWVEQHDQDFSTKMSKAIWRGGLGTNADNPLESTEFFNRYNFVQISHGVKQSFIDAKFVLSYNEKSIFDRVCSDANPSSVEEGGLTQNLVKNMLSYRYLIVTETYEGVGTDLMVRLLFLIRFMNTSILL